MIKCLVTMASGSLGRQFGLMKLTTLPCVPDAGGTDVVIEGGCRPPRAYQVTRCYAIENYKYPVVVLRTGPFFEPEDIDDFKKKMTELGWEEYEISKYGQLTPDFDDLPEKK